MHRGFLRHSFMLVVALSLANGASASSGSGMEMLGSSGPIGVEWHHAPMPAEQWQALRAEVAANVAMLRAEGRLPQPTGGHPLFQTPVAKANECSIETPWTEYNLVDHDLASPDQLEDYNCMDRTYDVPGYNHTGIDFISWPWGFKLMQDDQVVAVAAAPGTIVYKKDDEFDMNCEFDLSVPWNVVDILHADGSHALYGHLKTDSATPKAIGETVEAGEYLGVVGSSGSSTTPHLHFEVWADEFVTLVDPYAGPCNTWNDSWWESQAPYYQHKVLRMTTGEVAYDLPPCPQIDDTFEKKDLFPPVVIYLTAYFRDHLLGQQTHGEIFRPDGTLALQWDFTNEVQYWPSSYWWWSVTVNTGVQTGTYKWRLTHDGKTYDYLFNIGGAAAGVVPSSEVEGVPLLVERPTTTGATLRWGESCKGSDSDYDIYEGTTSAGFYSHVKKVCGTDGWRHYTFDPLPEGDVYWLVVPNNAGRGGSYGTDSEGNERPQPAAADRCKPRAFECPG